MFEYIKKNKAKSFVYVIFILFWIVAQAYKGLYATDIVNGHNPFYSMEENINFIFVLNSLIFFSIICTISYKYFKTILIITSLIFSIILFGDGVYGRYYNFPLSFSLLDFINQTFYMSNLGQTINSLVNKRDYILFLDVIILLAMSLYLRGFTFKIKYTKRVIAGAMFTVIFMNSLRFDYENFYTEKYVYNKKEIVKDLGIYTFHMLDFGSYISNKINAYKPINEEELAIIEKTNQANDNTNEYTGIFKDKNIIVLQMEALQGFLVNQTFNNTEIMPNLNKLIKNNSIYSSNFYFETAGGNTVDSELLANTSMFPTYQGSAYYLYPNNTYISMPHILKDIDYKSNSFHVYEGTFWNRIIMHNTLGFEKFYNIKDFEFGEEDIIGWTLNDEKFLKDSLDKTLEAVGLEKFYSYMIMLSSHYPYEGFYNGDFTWSLGRTEGEVPIFERYLNSAKYVDYAIGQFIDYLKEKEVYEDTVLVIIGDHAGLFNDERKDVLTMLNLEESNEQYAKLETVPLIIHNPSLKESVTTSKVVGQKDLMATLCNLIDINIPYTFSRDILDDEYEGVAIKRHGNVYTNDFIFLQDENKFYDYETLQPVLEEDKIEKYKEIVKDNHLLIQSSELIYKYDYLRKYRGEN